MKTYETERLLLKPTDLEDAEFILQLLNSESFIKYIGDRNVRTIEDAENYIRNRCFPQFERLGYGSFTVILKEDYSKMGTCGVYARENTDNAPDIGFAFLPNLISKGFGFEIASTTLDYALNILKINRIIAIVNPDNEKSIGLIKKIGMQFEEMIKFGDDGKELMLFAKQEKF